MVHTSIDKHTFKEILLPFKYEDAMIYSKHLGNVPGFYGYRGDALFFKPLTELSDAIDIESPESVEELHEFISSIDYIIQRLSMNNEVYIPEHLEKTEHSKLLEPFVEFTKTFQKNMHAVEGLKNGF